MTEQASTSRYRAATGGGRRWVEARAATAADGTLSGLVSIIGGSDITSDGCDLLPEEVERFAQGLLEVAKAARGGV